MIRKNKQINNETLTIKKKNKENYSNLTGNKNLKLYFRILYTRLRRNLVDLKDYNIC